MALLVLSGCRIAVDDLDVAIDPTVASSEALPVVGPSPGTSHWHAAYLVRICDEVLAPFTSEADPLGIHSHADGLIHIHPFFVESGYEQATLGLFADAMGFEIDSDLLVLPDGRRFESEVDGCGVAPGVVQVDRWADPDPSAEPERHFDGFDRLRFEADGELWVISFAPRDATPVIPPSMGLLPQVSNLDLGEPSYWLSADPAWDRTTGRIWEVGDASAAPCEGEAVPQRVLIGTPGCFTPTGEALGLDEAVSSARAVIFNRRPSVELRIRPSFRSWLEQRIASDPDRPFVWALEMEGGVVTTPTMVRLPASPDRLIISGGMTEATAEVLADLLDG